MLYMYVVVIFQVFTLILVVEGKLLALV